MKGRYLMKNKRNSHKSDIYTRIYLLISYIAITIFAILCLLPFIMMLSGSISSEKAIVQTGYSLFPKEPTLFAYKLIFERPDKIIGSYVITVLLTLTGTLVGTFITAMTGYALQRPDFAYRNKISFYIYFTSLFSGGLVAYYIMMVRYYGLKDSYLAVLLPLMLSSWNIILMKNFMKGIPHEVTESAHIDGAGNFRIFMSIILPMATPALATIGLFIGLGYWNDWYTSLLFLSNNVAYRPLQLFLMSIISKAEYLQVAAAKAGIPIAEIPKQTSKLAIAIVSIGPVVLFYPFVQRYFIKGITIGSVKG